MKLRYETKRNPFMTGVLVFTAVAALFSVLEKVDLTSLIFGKTGSPVPAIATMTREQSAEVLALWKQQNAQKQDTTPEPIIQAVVPTQQIIEQTPAAPQKNESGSIYHYTDTSGMIVMVDDLEKVPSKYRAKMKTSSGTYGQQRTAVKVLNNQVWVPVTFAHKGRTVSTWLLLDTGATNTSISPALAQRLGIQAIETTRGNARLADGSTVQTAHIVVDNVTVGPKMKRSLNVQIMPRSGNEETGLLGMNFLGEFPYIVETRAGIIRWQ